MVTLTVFMEEFSGTQGRPAKGSCHDYLPLRRRGDALLEGEDAGEVEGIGGGDGEGTEGAAAADRAEEGDGIGDRVLLPVESRDEAAAADVAAELQAAVVAHEVAPGDGDALADEDAAEDDPPAVEEAGGDETNVNTGVLCSGGSTVTGVRPPAGRTGV